ncbi:hypothetical protein BJ980_000032 [Nocardioides daedukensis]|uniref:DUF3644 domain-containing protein n=1 Tax=Nocardioides daedukensis TaxID=634462 RepID=A0A7Y9RXI1_9ACTN|nr:DUF3644 domain-containing protein [Nocardioides daedukensis]NYG57109.1 hypothetical protein [Nocardioides daedukensis]
MAAPYVSHPKLIENSFAAMLSAIEVYNKPQMTYRDEVTVMLVVNAWELALKAALRKKGFSVFYRKERGETYRSLTLDDALGRVNAKGLWPKTVAGPALVANIKALSEYRNRATHLYNNPGLSAVIYRFMQQNVLNYRDFMLAQFDKDFADSITWQLLPLGATAPADSVKFMRKTNTAGSSAELHDFIDELRAYMSTAEAAGGDMARVATVYDINLQSVRNMKAADLVVAVDPKGAETVVVKKTDPNTTHPYSLKDLLKLVNKRRSGRDLTTYDHTALCWDEKLRENPKYSWKHSNAPAPMWSNDAATHLAGLTDDYVDDVKARYTESRKK